MRDILFRGKSFKDGKFVEGVYVEFEKGFAYIMKNFIDVVKVIPKTVGQYTNTKDKNGKKIFEGDIVQYKTYDDFVCYSIVKFGKYKQDGSGGEYSGRECFGFYVEVDNFICPDWCEGEPEHFPYYMWQQNILEVSNKCEVISNIYDDIKLLSIYK